MIKHVLLRFLGCFALLKYYYTAHNFPHLCNVIVLHTGRYRTDYSLWFASSSLYGSFALYYIVVLCAVRTHACWKFVWQWWIGCCLKRIYIMLIAFQVPKPFGSSTGCISRHRNNSQMQTQSRKAQLGREMRQKANKVSSFRV